MRQKALFSGETGAQQRSLFHNSVDGDLWIADDNLKRNSNHVIGLFEEFIRKAQNPMKKNEKMKNCTNESFVLK